MASSWQRCRDLDIDPFREPESCVRTMDLKERLTYWVRFVPSSKHKLNVDFGIAQIAGNVLPGVDLKARHQAGVQNSYGF